MNWSFISFLYAQVTTPSEPCSFLHVQIVSRTRRKKSEREWKWKCVLMRMRNDVPFELARRSLAYFLCPSDNIAIHRGAVEYVCGARRRKYESITSISVRLAARHIADKSVSCESQLEKVINQSCMHGRVIKTWNSPHTVRCSVVEKMTSIIFDSQSLCSSLGKVDYLIHVGTFRAELSVPSNLVNVLVKRTHDILTQ